MKRQEYPGMGNKPFKVILDSGNFCKNDVLTINGGSGIEVLVTKVYRYNWWKKLLVCLGYPRVKLFTGIKVKPIDNESERTRE